ncbi:MAG: type II secretion system protein F, partial [Mesorhizobium sp.]
MLEGFSPIYAVYAAAALTGIMIAEGCYLLYAGRSDKRTAINRRMKLAENKISQEQVLIQLRKERGMEAGTPLLSFDRFRALRTQSGMIMPMPKFLTITSGTAFTLALFAVWYGLPLLFGLVLLPVLVPVLPVMAMRFLRKRRLKRFGMQLPEALELITRGLKAGHPVPLFVTAVSIQSSSGGNLREILDGLSSTIRERGKLRRKVRAISTEGRMSAYILTAVPVLLFTAIMVLMPQFYREVWG